MRCAACGQPATERNRLGIAPCCAYQGMREAHQFSTAYENELGIDSDDMRPERPDDDQ